MSPMFKSGLAPFREILSGESASADPQTAPLASRLPAFIGLTGPAPEILSQLQVACIGVGSIGGPLAEHIARWHPKTMWIVDPSLYKPESVLTHPISPARIGRSKAVQVGQQVKLISPDTRVLAFEGPFQAIDQLSLWDADAVLLATDNLAAEVAVTEMCTHLGKPLLQGSVFGEGLVAQLRVVTNRDPAGPCLGCAYGEQDWAHFHRQTTFSCAGGNGPEATMSTSVLCSTAANLVATELLRLVLQLGWPVTDSRLEYCGYPQTITRSPFVRHPDCRCSHVRWQRAEARRPVRDCSLTALAAAAHFLHSDWHSLSFDLPGHEFVEASVCCDMQPVRRFVRTGDSAGDCRQCGRPLPVLRALAAGCVPAARLGPLREKPLSALGAPGAQWIIVKRDQQAVVVAETRRSSWNSSN